MAHKYISVSNINKYIECAYMHDAYYERGIVTPFVSEGANKGNILHTGLGAIVGVPNWPDAMQLAKDTYAAYRSEKGFELDTYFETEGLSVLQRAYNELDLGNWKPLEINGLRGVEVDFDYPIDNNYSLTGVIDFVGYNHRGQLVLLDWKTGKNIRTIDNSYLIQLAVYAHVVKHLFQVDVDVVGIMSIKQEIPARTSTMFLKEGFLPCTKEELAAWYILAIDYANEIVYNKSTRRNPSGGSCMWCKLASFCRDELAGNDTSIYVLQGWKGLDNQDEVEFTI